MSIAFWVVGLFVDKAVEYISPEMEAVIFSSLSPDKSVKDEDNEQQKELQVMVDELRNCLEMAYPVKVYLVDSQIPNAMAFPGGRMLILSGLLEKIGSRNSLTFILAHELAHFKNRDHLRGLGRGIVFTAFAALTTGAGSNLTQLITPTVGINQAHYSQDRESMADQLALEILNCRYNHVGGATDFFEAMMKSDKKDFFISHYFASHPEAEKRINALHQQAQKKRYAIKETLPLQQILLPQQPENN